MIKTIHHIHKEVIRQQKIETSFVCTQLKIKSDCTSFYSQHVNINVNKLNVCCRLRQELQYVSSVCLCHIVAKRFFCLNKHKKASAPLHQSRRQAKRGSVKKSVFTNLLSKQRWCFWVNEPIREDRIVCSDGWKMAEWINGNFQGS